MVTFWSNGRLTNGPKTLTFNNTSGSNTWVTMGEFTPPAGALSVDGFTAQYQNVSNPTAGNIITANNGDLIFSAAAISTDGLSEASGYARVDLVGGGSTIRSEFQTQTSAGSIGGNWTGTIADGIFSIFALSTPSAGGPVLGLTGFSFIENEW